MCLLDCGMTMAGLTKIQKRGVEGNLGREILQGACLTLEKKVGFDDKTFNRKTNQKMM